MIARYIDLRHEPDIAIAKQRITAAVMWLGIEVNTGVSRDGVMLVGDQDRIDPLLKSAPWRDRPIVAYDPTQQGDTEDEI